VYRRFKREGDSFKLYREHSWKRLEDYLPYFMIPLGSELVELKPIQDLFAVFGLSEVMMFITEALTIALLMLIALFGFNIYLKLIGWKKPNEQNQNI
jgi:hypothetical protein